MKMKLGNLNPNSNQRCVVFSILDVSPTLQAAMGTGGGQMPYIPEILKISKKDFEDAKKDR
jgi:hypothetical protein